MEWIEGAIEVAKELEGNNPMTIRRLNRLLKEAMEEHDDVLLANGINGLSVILKKIIQYFIFLLKTSFYPFSRKMERLMLNHQVPNLLPSDHTMKN